MSKIYHLQSVQRIPVGIEEAWKFFTVPANLMKMTPDFLNLKMTNNLLGNEAYTGQIITYSVKPLLGIPLFWMTEITHVDPLKMFVDEQRKGPYKLWHHQHHFKSVDGGVEITDLVHYQLPFGMLGDLANKLAVKKKLQEIFTYRFNKLNDLFGAWPESEINLKLG